VKRIVLFAVSAIAATAAAAEWHYLSGGKLSGVSSVGSYVWAVGQDGLFFHSEDNGETWRRIPRFTTRNLIDVEFWDQSFGLATAEGDMLYRTTDNGGTWDSIYVQYIGGRIRFITHDYIWVTSTNGRRILRSSDGGLTWPLSRLLSLRNPWFLDSLNGWANDGGAGVYRTVDAGQNWHQVGEVPVPYRDYVLVSCFGFRDSLNGACAWYSVHFSSSSPAQASGWSATTDGGSSWDYLAQYTTPGVVCDISPCARIYGVEEHGCIVCGPSLYSRFDASTFQGFRDVSAAHGSRAWTCGDGGALWSSLDSGVSWAPARPQSGMSLVNVDFCDTLHGWAASSDWAAQTCDAGRSWTRTTAAFGVSPITDVVALGEASCLATAGWSYYDMWHGWIGEFKFGRTDNAGAVWDTIRDFWGGQVGSSRFARVDQHIWHPGTQSPNGNSLRSTDGGTTWADMDSIGTAGDDEPPDISFTDTLNGWVIDSRGNIRRTTNSGDSWTIVATGVTVKRLKMTTLTTGWAISDSELFKTTDGGVNWQSVLAESGLQAIAFCDSSHGVIVGLGGLLLRTDDAGRTWVRDSSDFTSDLYDVCMIDSAHAWAVGQYGLVLGFGDWAIGVDETGGHESLCVQNAAVAVRPNPCRARATIEFSFPLVGPVQVTLVDISGRVKHSVPAGVGVRSLELDLRGTPSGVYFVRAGSGPAARLVIQR
jgi:photosystem II stability/assembly factor-like uncharacterized protein